MAARSSSAIEVVLRNTSLDVIDLRALIAQERKAIEAVAVMERRLELQNLNEFGTAA
jgi:hypothetical protein